MEIIVEYISTEYPELLGFKVGMDDLKFAKKCIFFSDKCIILWVR